jgi:hypothetical protein
VERSVESSVDGDDGWLTEVPDLERFAMSEPFVWRSYPIRTTED